MEATMLRIYQDKAEVLGPDGWQEADWVPLPGGNFIALNADGYWAGAFQGGAVMLLCALVALGIYAGAVS